MINLKTIALIFGAINFAGPLVCADALPFQNGVVRDAQLFEDPNVIFEDHNDSPEQKKYLESKKNMPLQSFDHAEKSFELSSMAVCVTPHVANDCCNYVINDGYNKKDTQYRGPKQVYGNEPDARTFAAKQIPRMPFFLPYSGDVAKLGQGWVYEAGTEHSALDFSKSEVKADTDPSFQVLAVAPGRVVSKVWDNWHGNILVIEHTASNGAKYRSMYFHLRNGPAADLANAKAIPAPAPGVVDNVSKYLKFANLSNPKAIHWGTESQKIPVKVGDWVQAGQFIAWSGNTGPGGAGAGLKDDGTPFDSTRANNHLHFMLATVSPKNSAEWIFIDSFGVYEKASSGCYDVMKDNQYSRFFAPFYSNFHNVPTDLLYKYFGYYPDMGINLQTLSVYQSGNQVLAAGSFQPSAPSPWYAYGFLKAADFGTQFTQRHNEGYRPRELQVSIDSTGAPRFTAIWKKRAGEGYYTWINMTDAEFDTHWKELVVGQAYRVEDYAAYSVGGQRRHAAIFVKDNIPFYLFSNLTQEQYSSKFSEMLKQGFGPTSFSAGQFTWGERYAGVWTQLPGTYAMYFNMSSAGYQQRFTELSSQGFRLQKIQGYANGSKFGAIWKK